MSAAKIGPNPRTTIAARLAVLADSRKVLVAYLRTKYEAEDWHGVSDAANDLRDIDAEAAGAQEHPRVSLSDPTPDVDDAPFDPVAAWEKRQADKAAAVPKPIPVPKVEVHAGGVVIQKKER